MEYIAIGIVIFCLAISNLYLYSRIRKIDTDIDGACLTIAKLTKALSDMAAENELFKKRFDEVMAEAERQNELEAQWNSGLHNILNYSLADAFEAGGEAK